MKRSLVLCLVGVLLLGALMGCSANGSGIKSGADYESLVWQAFWETASDHFGVEYSDYSMTNTAYGYICENTTTDGYTSYYYLIRTAYETKNVLGQTVLHNVTARCYYVPDYSDVVYITYMTCDGETVYFDEEKESWLLGMES